MQDTVINKELTSLDYAKIAALQQKRTLAFINHFVITTVQFLNNFSKQCEHKLMQFERKLEKINATMVLLETRLSSIPEVNLKPVQQPQITNQDNNTQKTTDTIDETIYTTISQSEEEKGSEMKPEYIRFNKMLQVGVPLDAVKLKMALEGISTAEIEKVLGK